MLFSRVIRYHPLPIPSPPKYMCVRVLMRGEKPVFVARCGHDVLCLKVMAMMAMMAVMAMTTTIMIAGCCIRTRGAVEGRGRGGGHVGGKKKKEDVAEMMA